MVISSSVIWKENAIIRQLTTSCKIFPFKIYSNPYNIVELSLIELRSRPHPHTKRFVLLDFPYGDEPQMFSIGNGLQKCETFSKNRIDYNLKTFGLTLSCKVKTSIA